MTPAVRLVGYSFLILFFELALIRYVPAYVRVFGFYLNFVLIATFLGMGVGLLRVESVDRLRWLAIPAMLLLLVTVRLFANVLVESPADPDEWLWAVYPQSSPNVRRLGILPTTTLLFTLCALFFVPLGALMGREFRRFRPLVAYSLDIGGSLAGILSFGLLSLMRTSPPVWFGIGATIWILLSLRHRPYAVSLVATGTVAVFLTVVTANPRPEYWSPYYRINVRSLADGVQTLDVNGSLHQWMIDFRSEIVDSSGVLQGMLTDYVRPYTLLDNVDTVLVVGAGTGNDIALLLKAGVAYIDAVEIDPTIYDIGRAANFQDRYSDPRVHVHINDARAHFDRTEQRYDLVLLGTLDSQTLLSGMTSLRLDNYVYTAEAFQAARALLKPGGSLVAYHMSGYPYIAAKIYRLLEQAFDEPPAVRYESPHRLFNYTFVAGRAAQRATAWTTPESILATAVTVPEDDWPYLYLRRPTLPDHYLQALAMVLLVALVFVGVGLGPKQLRLQSFDWGMFFLGGGFLLVETKSVSEISLLFGATWTVNLVVFYSILTVILIANIWVLGRPRHGTRWPFVGLFLSLVVAYAIPARSLLPLGLVGQWVVGGLMVALPILFAALIFAVLFRSRTANPTAALAANLLGAIVGGVLEYSSMIVGIKTLYVIAAVFYVAAFLASERVKSPVPLPLDAGRA